MTDNHVHDVMHMMLETRATYSKESLIAAIGSKFGEGCTFHSCSISGMTAGEAVDFLESRGKFTGTAEAFVFDPERICNH